MSITEFFKKEKGHLPLVVFQVLQDISHADVELGPYISRTEANRLQKGRILGIHGLIVPGPVSRRRSEPAPRPHARTAGGRRAGVWRRAAPPLEVAKTKRNGTRWPVALALGIRQVEALGLRWSYIDMETGEIRAWFQVQRQEWRHGCGDK